MKPATVRGVGRGVPRIMSSSCPAYSSIISEDYQEYAVMGTRMIIPCTCGGIAPTLTSLLEEKSLSRHMPVRSWCWHVSDEQPLLERTDSMYTRPAPTGTGTGRIRGDPALEGNFI